MSGAISPDEVVRIAALARLSLDAEEASRLAGELSAVLGYVAELDRLDTAATRPTAHPLELSNVLRPDVVAPGISATDALAGAPAAEAGRFAVPRIVGEAP